MPIQVEFYFTRKMWTTCFIYSVEQIIATVQYLQFSEEEVKHSTLCCLLAVQLASDVDFDLCQLSLFHRGRDFFGCSLYSFGKTAGRGRDISPGS